MDISSVRSFLLLITAAAIMTGCDEQTEPKQTDPVVIGAFYNLNGSQSGLDLPSSKGAELAVAQANDAGGVLGREVELIVEDGQTDTGVIASKMRTFLEEYPAAVGFIGFSDDNMLLAAAPLAADRGKLFLTSGATSPKLPGDVPTWLFLACFGDNVQAAAAAEWAYEDRSFRTAAVLFDSSKIYTRLLKDYFITRFTELGGTVLSTGNFSPENMDGIADGVEQADMIFLSAAPDLVYDAVARLRSAGYEMPIVGGDGFDLQDLWQEHPEVEDVFFTTHAYLGSDNPDPAVATFRQLYADAFPGDEPDAFTALGYDAAGLLIDAVKRAGSGDPERVRQALASTDGYRGVTGTISYREGERIPDKSVTILEVKGGLLKFVKEWMPQSVPAP